MMRLPAHFIPPDLAGDDYTAFLTEVQGLWRDLVVEYFDERYARRSHGNNKTYQAGCKGPRCAARSRQLSREYAKATPSAWSLVYEPIIEYLGDYIVEARKKALESTHKMLSEHAFTD